MPPARSASEVSVAAQDAFLTGLNEILVIAAIVAVAGAAITGALVRIRSVEQAGDDEPGAGATGSEPASA